MNRNIIYVLVAGIAAFAIWNWITPESEKTGAALAEVKVPALSQAALNGKSLFDNNCAACHGTNGAGKDGFGPPLVHKIYQPNHHSDGAFQQAAKMGVRGHHWPFGNMPPVEGVGKEDVAKIAFYIRELQKANNIFR